MRDGRVTLWVAALRRERNAQRGPACGMRDENSNLDPFGVLCSLYRSHRDAPGDADWVRRDDGWAFGWKGERGSEAYYPPECVFDWIGMTHLEAVEIGEWFDTLKGPLGGGATLKEIADLIAARYGGGKIKAKTA